jgi:hypothetical protein
MDFDLKPFVELIKGASPTFVNIGADSKKSKLLEPSKEKILALIEELTISGIEVRQKSNLKRLLRSNP